ncbi:hypothetical protein [Larkinella sp. C7]|uniref:hypothetical protein n=1 Tax=Larkinella sp. C7 TaxID=2576607 RepID=UPI001111523A|nr:hypothetical protein [Larkinella sp. C7]
MRKPATQTVGSSGWGFKPAGENVAIPSLTGKKRYLVTGPDVKPGTYIFFEKKRLAEKIQKYGRMGQKLIGPGIKPGDFEQDFWASESEPVAEPLAVPAEEKPTRNRGKVKPLVCLSNGKFYKSAMHARNDLGISTAMIGYACNGKVKVAKGHRFRFATAQEVAQKRFIGEQVEVLAPGKRLKPTQK